MAAVAWTRPMNAPWPPPTSPMRSLRLRGALTGMLFSPAEEATARLSRCPETAPGSQGNAGNGGKEAKRKALRPLREVSGAAPQAPQLGLAQAPAPLRGTLLEE